MDFTYCNARREIYRALEGEMFTFYLFRVRHLGVGEAEGWEEMTGTDGSFGLNMHCTVLYCRCVDTPSTLLRRMFMRFADHFSVASSRYLPVGNVPMPRYSWWNAGNSTLTWTDERRMKDSRPDRRQGKRLWEKGVKNREEIRVSFKDTKYRLNTECFVYRIFSTICIPKVRNQVAEWRRNAKIWKIN